VSRVQDDGRINERLLARLAKTDYLVRVEAARLKMPSQFSSPEIKRLHLRYFDSFQMNMHFISVIARTRLPQYVVDQVEASLGKQLDEATEEVNKGLVGGEQPYLAHGITSPAEYDITPLGVTVRVISSYGRRYLDLMSKVDQLMPMLDTLAICGVISQGQLNLRKALFAKSVRRIASSARNLAGGLRKRFFAAAESSAPAPAATERQGTGAPHHGASPKKVEPALAE
jgi:hypothetical protein